VTEPAIEARSRRLRMQSVGESSLAENIATALLSVGAPLTLVYGIGHLVSALGTEFPMITRESAGTHVFFASITLSASAGGLYFLARQRRERRRLDRLEAQGSFDAIYERASEHVREAREHQGA
jgi:hypothetical protein